VAGQILSGFLPAYSVGNAVPVFSLGGANLLNRPFIVLGNGLLLYSTFGRSKASLPMLPHYALVALISRTGKGRNISLYLSKLAIMIGTFSFRFSR